MSNIVMDSAVAGVGSAIATAAIFVYNGATVDKSAATAAFLAGSSIGIFTEGTQKVVDVAMGYFKQRFNTESTDEKRKAATETEKNLRSALTVLAVIAVPFIVGKVVPDFILSTKNVVTISAGSFAAHLIKGAYEQGKTNQPSA